MYSKLTLSKDLQPTQKDLDGLKSVLRFKATQDQLKDLYTLLYVYKLPYDTVDQPKQSKKYYYAVINILTAVANYPAEVAVPMAVENNHVYIYVSTKWLETEKQTDQLWALVDKVRLGFNSVLYLN